MSERTPHRDALPPGTRIEAFECIEAIGRGGFGITYRGRDTNCDITVAIKEYMPAEFAVREPDGSVGPRAEEYRKNYEWGLNEFLKEARMLARLWDVWGVRGIVQVRQFIPEHHGTACIVMEYLEGHTLHDLYELEGTLSEERLRGLLSPILEGLEQVHSAGLLHCDIKPGNIMLRDGRTPVLIDFGAAQFATAEYSGMVPVVMPGYSPPEQYGRSHRALGAWTDIYAVGAVLFRGMTGEAPSEAWERLLEDEDDLLPVAEAAKMPYGTRLTEAVDWALRLRRAERPQSIEEWREVLERRAAPGGVDGQASPEPARPSGGGVRDSVSGHSVPGDTSPEPARAPRNSRRLLGMVVGVLVVLALAGGAWRWNEMASLLTSIVAAGTSWEQEIAEVREPLGRGDFAGARSRLGEAREAGLDEETHGALAADIDAAEAAAREREALVAEVRDLLGRGDFAGARSRLGEAREAGLDEETRGALAADIDAAEAAAREREAARLLESCTAYESSRRWRELQACARRVLELDAGHAEARRLEAMGETREAWERAKAEDTVESYHEFGKAYPGSDLDGAAQTSLWELEPEYWKRVEAEDTPEAYRRYLEIYPGGSHAAQARERGGG